MSDTITAIHYLSVEVADEQGGATTFKWNSNSINASRISLADVRNVLSYVLKNDNSDYYIVNRNGIAYTAVNKAEVVTVTTQKTSLS